MCIKCTNNILLVILWYIGYYKVPYCSWTDNELCYKWFQARGINTDFENITYPLFDFFNSIDILWETFSYKSVLSSFSLCVCSFLAKEYWQKRCFVVFYFWRGAGNQGWWKHCECFFVLFPLFNILLVLPMDFLSLTKTSTRPRNECKWFSYH